MELKPLIFSLNDLAYVDESEVKKNFGNPHNHAVYKATEVDALIAEKDKDIAYWREEYDKETKLTDALNAEIESLKASHYAEMVDAGMRERRLRRALWIARAERAKEKQQLFHFSLAYYKLCIDGFYNPYSGRRELSPNKWIKVFNKVESKCRAKAEVYK